MGNQKNHSKPVIVEVPEELEGIQLKFRLKKGGRIIDFGSIKALRKVGNEVKLVFDETKPGLGKLIGSSSKENKDE